MSSWQNDFQSLVKKFRILLHEDWTIGGKSMQLDFSVFHIGPIYIGGRHSSTIWDVRGRGWVPFVGLFNLNWRQQEKCMSVLWQTYMNIHWHFGYSISECAGWPNPLKLHVFVMLSGLHLRVSGCKPVGMFWSLSHEFRNCSLSEAFSVSLHLARKTTGEMTQRWFTWKLGACTQERFAKPLWYE
jgi:hypothetical protein